MSVLKTKIYDHDMESFLNRLLQKWPFFYDHLLCILRPCLSAEWMGGAQFPKLPLLCELKPVCVLHQVHTAKYKFCFSLNHYITNSAI